MQKDVRQLSETRSADHRHILFILLIIILGAAYFSLTYNSAFYAPDEGATAYHFQECVDGAVQHRDFFSVYGAGFYLLGKALFELFGSGLIVMRLFVLILKLIMAVLIYAVALRMMRPAFALLSSLGFIIWWGDPVVVTTSFLYPSHISQLLGLLSLLLIFLYFETNRKIFILCVAMALGLSAMFKPTVTLFNLMAFFLFFFAREMLFDLNEAAGPQHDPLSHTRKVFYSKAWIILLLVISVAGIAMQFAMLMKVELNFVVFVFFLLPTYLAAAYLLSLAFRVLQSPGGTAFWQNTKETFSIFLFIGIGIVFWQILQVGYFVTQGALKDFFHMLVTASAYYSDYAAPFWHGPHFTIICCAALLITLAFGGAMKATMNGDKWRKTLLAAAGTTLALLFVGLWYYFSNKTPRNYQVTVWYVSVIFSLYLAFLMVFIESSQAINERNLRGLLALLLIAIYSATDMIDAFPRVDIGHLSTILPPFFILFGFFAQRLYDSWRTYLLPEFPRAAKYVASGITGPIAVGIFLSSLFMMFMFEFVVITPVQTGWYLYQGKFTPVPRYRSTLERARGITLHIFDKDIGCPLLPPKTKSFFEVAEEIPRITSKDDKVFSTMSSGRMLYFLADRKSIGVKADSYVYQTATGISSSGSIPDFSDQDFTRLIQQGRPKAIVVEEGDTETKMFMMNWPGTWGFITANYHILKSIGPFQIYVPAK